MPRVTERAAKAGHKIEWTEAWGGAVCKLGECLEAVEAGLLDIADVHAPTEPAKLLANNFTFFAPFGTPDPRIAAKAVWDVYQSTPALKKLLEDRYKQVFIANGIVGNYGLVTNFKWANVSELKGRKLAASARTSRGCRAPARSACNRPSTRRTPRCRPACTKAG